MKKYVALLLSLIFLASPVWAAPTIYRHLEPETVAYFTTAAGGSTLTQFAINENIKKVKYGTGIIVVGFTGNLSLANGGATASGGALITNPSVDLRQYVGFKITLNDDTQNLVGWIKAAGTEETLGSTLNTSTILNGSNEGYNYDVFSGASASGFTASVVSVIGAYATLEPLANFVAGNLEKIVYDLTVNAGVPPGIRFTVGGTLTALTAGVGNVMYKTRPGTIDAFYISHALGTTANFAIANIVIKQVLTPSATGVTIVSAQGGATYNWASDGGINPNIASWTATITVN